MENYKDIKKFEDACKVEGYDPKTVIPDMSSYPEKLRKAAESQLKLFIVVAAVNKVANKGEEYLPDWSDTSEYKYEPWFNMSPSGFRYDGYDGWRSGSCVGSRLCLISPEVCEYIAEQFIDLYKEVYVK